MSAKSTRYNNVQPAAINRRDVPRYDVAIDISPLKRKKSKPIQARLADISLYGCRLEADAVFQEGEVLELSVDSHVKAEAKVIWQKAQQAGCRFVKALDPEALRSLTISS